MPDPAPTPLLLFIPYRYAENASMRHLAEQGFDDLTLAQARVFARIADGGSRITELAEAAQVTKQTAGHTVDQLEAAGYVVRVPDPSDARARLVRVAGRGEQARAAAMEALAQLEAAWTAHLGPRRMAALRAALGDLREITDPWA
ncbi:MAG TPA: MarR family winged helix-turn-helix transcriptional regulator [Nocardioides sp.]|nr:MarR family winged helix-turn-helix transcriptional regulator [Nocardioides sp.]